VSVNFIHPGAIMFKQVNLLILFLLGAIGFILSSESGAARRGLPLVSDTMQNVRINSDNTTQIQNEEMIAINPLNPDQVVAVWRDFRLGYRRVGYGYSINGGASWTDALFFSGAYFPDYFWESDPGLGVDKNGNFIAHTLCIDPVNNSSDICVYRSIDGGQNWSAPTQVVGADFGFEDKQWMATDRSSSANTDNIYFAWTRFPDFANTRIMFAKSEDTAQTWSYAQLSDGINSVQWPTVTVDDTGKIYVAWGRYSPPSIRMRTSLDGVSFTSEQTVVSTQAAFTTLKGSVGTFSFAALEADISDSSPFQGNVYIAYMDKILGDADIYFIKSTNRGVSWSTPLRINDDASSNGKDQFHPWLSVNEDGVISVIFFDRRNDAANLYYDLYLTQSFDGGSSWTPNLRISNASSFPETQLSASLIAGFDPEKQPISASPLAELLGEYIGVSSVDRQVNMIWTDTRSGNQDAYGSRFSGFYPPVLQAPANGANTSDKTPQLQWLSVPAYDTASTFNLQIAGDPNFSVVETTITGLAVNSYQIDTLNYLSNGIHYWRVKGFDTGGDSSLYSKPFSLTVYTEGDANSDGIISLSDVIFLVNYIFKSGSPAPVPLIAGDPNCDNQITLSDVIRLVNYIFNKPGDWAPCTHT